MKGRPRIKPRFSSADMAIEITTWIGIIAIWILALASYPGLPDTIPMHYNAMGQPDGFGGKVILLILPAIATVIFSMMAVLNKSPHIFNYPVGITEENAQRQYTNATRMLRCMSLSIVISFGLITLMTIRTAQRKAEGMGAWCLPVVLGLIFIPMIYFIVRMFAKK